MLLVRIGKEKNTKSPYNFGIIGMNSSMATTKQSEVPPGRGIKCCT